MRSRTLFTVLGATLALAGILAFSNRPAGGQGADEAPLPPSCRFRVSLIRVELPAGDPGRPLTIAELGVEAAEVTRPISPGAREAGEFGTIRYPDRLLLAMRGRGVTDVLFRGEMESARPGTRVELTHGRRFPVRVTEIRGEQVIVTTRFEETGMRVQLVDRPDDRANDRYEMKLEFSAVTTRAGTAEPIITKLASAGSFQLADGHTAVFSFVDRISGAAFDVSGITKPSEEPPDRTVQFFVLITRMDLDAGK
jgi:hypothetical protein